MLSPHRAQGARRCRQDLTQLPSPERLTQYEAVRLFVERAQAVKADFEVTNSSAPDVAEICARLDGLPLAIELAAARVKLLSPPALLARLQNRLSLLTGGARDLPARQQTLRSTIGWSYDLLEPGEQHLFGRLAVFVGGRTLEAIEVVCNAEADLPFEPIDGVSSLLDKCLLRQEEGVGGEPRFVMLETIHEFAREKLEQSGAAEPIRRRHAEYFRDLVEAAMPHLEGPQRSTWLEQLACELDNLRAALEWTLQRSESETALRIGQGLQFFWPLYQEARQWLERMLAQADRADPLLRAAVLHGAGFLTMEQGDYDTARRILIESLTLYRAHASAEGTVRVLINLAEAVTGQGDTRLARALYDEALELRHELSDQTLISNTLQSLSNIARLDGNLALALSQLEEALTLTAREGEYYLYALLCRGTVEVELGSLAVGQRTLFEGLRLAQVGFDRAYIAVGMLGLARAAALAGHPERAARLLGMTDSLLDTVGIVLNSTNRLTYDRADEGARIQLGQASFEASYAAGRVTPLDQAIAFALEPLPEQSAPVPAPQPAPALPANLSEREAEVLRLVAQGLTNGQIAERLVLSPYTVNAHLRTIYSKIGVRSRAAATHWAGEHGLV